MAEWQTEGRSRKKTRKKRRWKGEKTDREIYTVEQRLFTFDLSRQLLFLPGDIKTRCPGNLTLPTWLMIEPANASSSFVAPNCSLDAINKSPSFKQIKLPIRDYLILFFLHPCAICAVVNCLFRFVLFDYEICYHDVDMNSVTI